MYKVNHYTVHCKIDIMQSQIPQHWYWFLQPLQHSQIIALSLVLVWLWPSCCCLQWERVCLSLPASISDRSTPGNRLQRGTVSALPSVYRASHSALRCDRGMPGGIAMCMPSKGTAYYTPVCGGGRGVPLYGTHGIHNSRSLSSFQLSYRYGC